MVTDVAGTRTCSDSTTVLGTGTNVASGNCSGLCFMTGLGTESMVCSGKKSVGGMTDSRLSSGSGVGLELS